MKRPFLAVLAATVLSAPCQGQPIELPSAAGVGGTYEQAPEKPADAVSLRRPQVTVRESWRVFFDHAVDIDLADADGLAFDLYLSDFTSFAGGTVYLRSGNGWYTAQLKFKEPGRWCHYVLGKGRFTGAEGTPAGWRTISDVRISLSYARTAQSADRTRIDVRNLSVVGADADVLVIACGKKAGCVRYAADFTSALERIGVKVRQIADLDLLDSSFGGIRFAVLPWNPDVPEDLMARLERFAAAGGKLMVCGTFPSRLPRLMGVRPVRGGYWNEARDPDGWKIAGIVRAGAGLAGQPDFAAQASWQTALLEPSGAGEAVAFWAGGDRKPNPDRPALIKTPAGFAFGHVWIGGAEGSDELLSAIVGDVIPAYRPVLAANRRQREAEEDLQRRWIRSLQGKPGERRLMWCHSPFGLRGSDWDGTVRLLRDLGFTDLVVNLAWARSVSYSSEVWPMSAAAAKAGDQFAPCRAACSKYGIRMHVWQVSWRLPADFDREELGRLERDGRLQVGRGGATTLEGGHWLCPSDPRNRREVADAMVELARKGADGVHFDYIRYPGGSGCFCPRCRSLFEKELGARTEEWPLDVRGRHGRAWTDFRKRFITETVRTASEAIRARYPGVEISAAVFRNPRDGGDADASAQDWGRWCADGLLDFACPMDYCDVTAVFRGIIVSQKEFAGRAKLYPGIGISCWERDGWSLRKFGEQVLALRGEGFEGFTVFDVNGGDVRSVLQAASAGVLRTGP